MVEFNHRYVHILPPKAVRLLLLVGTTITMKESADAFPTIMQCADLMAMVQAGPQVLELKSIVQFPVHKPDSYALTDFLDALQQNDTILRIQCNRHFTTGFSDEEWCLILAAFGRIQRLEELIFVDGGDSRLRRLRIDVLADAVLLSTNTRARNLRKLEFGKFWLLMGNDGHRRRFAAALRGHATLESFAYAGCGIHTPTLYQSIAPRSHPDAILEALGTCPRMKSVQITNSPYCAPDYSPVALLALVTAASSGNNRSTSIQDLSIVTQPSNWRYCLGHGSSISTNNSSNSNNGIRPCALERLVLTHSGRRTCRVEDVLAVAASLDRRQNALAANKLRHLSLRLWGPHAYFPRDEDENGIGGDDSANNNSITNNYMKRPRRGRRRISQALADALRHNMTLCVLELSDCSGHGSDGSSSSSRQRTPSSVFDDEQQQEQRLPPKILSDGSGDEYSFDAIDYDILTEAVRDNGSVQIYVDVGLPSDNGDMRAAYDRLRMESTLNAVGRASLVMASVNVIRPDKNKKPNADWCESLSQLNSLCHRDDGPLLQSCLYQLVRSNPLLVCGRQSRNV